MSYFKPYDTKIGRIENPIERFFAFARERHQIYLNRQAGKPWPWTDDEVLQTFKFTNVFRELDRTTVWFRENVREPMRSKPEVLLATVVFRWLNRIETGEAIFSQQGLFERGSAFDEFAATSKTAPMKRAIKAYCGKGPYVTGAYMIRSPDGMTKLDGMLKVMEKFWKKSEWEGHAVQIKDGWSLQETWSWLKDFECQGPFHAYEVVTDLRHTDLLCDAPDIMTWANAGPGAQRGLNRIRGRELKKRIPNDEAVQEMRKLLQLARTNQFFWPKKFPALELREIEHGLCEFDKNERTRLGEGRPRGTYKHG